MGLAGAAQEWPACGGGWAGAAGPAKCTLLQWGSAKDGGAGSAVLCVRVFCAREVCKHAFMHRSGGEGGGEPALASGPDLPFPGSAQRVLLRFIRFRCVGRLGEGHQGTEVASLQGVAARRLGWCRAARGHAWGGCQAARDSGNLKVERAQVEHQLLVKAAGRARGRAPGGVGVGWGVGGGKDGWDTVRQGSDEGCPGGIDAPVGGARTGVLAPQAPHGCPPGSRAASLRQPPACAQSSPRRSPRAAVDGPHRAHRRQHIPHVATPALRAHGRGARCWLLDALTAGAGNTPSRRVSREARPAALSHVEALCPAHAGRNGATLQ